MWTCSANRMEAVEVRFKMADLVTYDDKVWAVIGYFVNEKGEVTYEIRCEEGWATMVAEDKLNRVEIVQSGTFRGVTKFDYRQAHDAVLDEIRSTDVAKDHDYKGSFGRIYRRFGLLSSVIRLWDKLSRLEALLTTDAMVKDESVRDTLMDMANYAIKTVVELDRHNRGVGDAE